MISAEMMWHLASDVGSGRFAAFVKLVVIFMVDIVLIVPYPELHYLIVCDNDIAEISHGANKWAAELCGYELMRIEYVPDE